MVVYGWNGKQYSGSTVTKFRARANNYKRTHRNFWKEQIQRTLLLTDTLISGHLLLTDKFIFPGNSLVKLL